VDRLLEFSDQLATAVHQAGRAVFAVNGRPRVPSSGVLWRAGLIVTANHTVQTDDDLTVTTPNGAALPATVLGRESALDIAVLRVDASDAAVAELADSDAVRVGHIVLAVGAGTRASYGVVSAIGAAGSGRWGSDVFSLDLTLYPGFSGGPLVDARGAVVGVNTSGTSRHRQLAIPAKAVSRVVEAVMRHGRIPQAYLGVSTQQVRMPESFRGEGEAQRTALIVVDVENGSPAARGLLVGDVIVAVDGTAIGDPLELRSVLRPERIGRHVRTSVIRAGQRLDVDLTVGERPARTR
jgi:S1-C subfamily serine protease